MLAKAMAAKPELIGKLSTMANLIESSCICQRFPCSCCGLGSGGQVDSP